jgi:chaperone required for assembly of F1-ATPase
VKRFYEAVTVGTDGTILLDGRPVRTPAREFLMLPTAALAQAIAMEWESQSKEVDARTMPLTGLANAAIDRVAPDPTAFAAGLAAYGETDLLCYRADEPEPLVRRQAERWNPLLDWAERRFDVHFTLVTGIMHQPQPGLTCQRLAAAIAVEPPFRLAALSPIVSISGSLVIALAIAHGALDPERAFDIAHLDELWQEEMWGEDWLAAEARSRRRADFDAACRFLSLLKA